MTKRVASAIGLLIACAIAWPVAASRGADSDLDAFMAKVLGRRSETWRQLHDYILSERERFDLVGLGDRRLFGLRRDYTWFVRDGYLVRSPLRFDGVELGEQARRAYEARWLEEEKTRESKSREAKAREAKAQETKAGSMPSASTGAPVGRDGDIASSGKIAMPADDGAAGIARQSFEPRFISEAYFLRFRFEPGNYYLAGRETLDGRRVLRIEYYPTRLFNEGEKRRERRDRDGDAVREADMERKFNKVALITLWVDPELYQIVKYTFDNVGLDFLPGQWFVRVEDASATMVMGSYFQGIWLPKTISVHAGVQLASGAFDATYVREFFDYRLGEVKARIRDYAPVR